MDFYHATKSKLNVNRVITSDRSNTNYIDTSLEMDKFAPSSAARRSNALFLADAPERALFFLKNQNGTKHTQNYVYKVTASNTHQVPFVLTHVIESILGRNESAIAHIKEYWTPTKEWKFYEYLTMTFTVVEELSGFCIESFEEGLLVSEQMQDRDIAHEIS